MVVTSEKPVETHFGLDILQDSFYRGLTAEESAHAQDYNFDHPGNAFVVLGTQPVVAIIAELICSHMRWNVLFACRCI
jgi:hypothetical protein